MEAIEFRFSGEVCRGFDFDSVSILEFDDVVAYNFSVTRQTHAKRNREKEQT
jgi:hypothetical protein